jgi:hypothetical protein
VALEPLPEKPELPALPELEPTFLGMPLHAGAGCDEDLVRDQMAALSSDHAVHGITVDHTERITECSPDLPALLGVEPEALIGSHVDELQRLVEQRFGAMRDAELAPDGDSLMRGRTVFDGIESHVSMLAVRDDEGRATHGRILIALQTR